MKFILSLVLLAVNVDAIGIRPIDQKHIMQSQSQSSLNWLQEYLGEAVDQKECGDKCDCPYKCGLNIVKGSPDLDDYKNVDDMDIWELDVEDPHECCSCVCGCYNHAAALKIKKLELQRQAAKEVEAKEKIEAERTAMEKKNRAEQHISEADAEAAVRIKKAEAARTAAEVAAEREIEAARKEASKERDKEEDVIKSADEMAAHDKWRAEKTEKETEQSIDEKIARAEKIAAEKKAAEKEAYDEKKRLEAIAVHSANLAGDDVREAESKLEEAKIKAARATVEAADAEEAAECFRTCVTEENCASCHEQKS